MCKVSIVIPAYNAAAYLKRCISSCISQTFTDFEVIIIDDGSNDDTVPVVQQLIELDKRISIISKSNEGLVLARRTGVSQARGEFIFFLDADDYIAPNALQCLINQSENADIIIGNILVESPSGKPYNRQLLNQSKYGYTSRGMRNNYITKSVLPSLCGRLIRRTMIKDVNTPGYLTIGEDVYTNLLLLVKFPMIRVILVDDVIYHYVQYPVSMFNSKNEKSLLQRLIYVSLVLDLFKEEYDDSICMFALQEYYSYLRDGGPVDGNDNLKKRIFSRYWNKNVIKNMPVWQSALLRLYKLHPVCGMLLRTALVNCRSVIYKIKY